MYIKKYYRILRPNLKKKKHQKKNISILLRLDYFDRHTSTTEVEVGVENRFYVIEYLSIIRETQG